MQVCLTEIFTELNLNVFFISSISFRTCCSPEVWIFSGVRPKRKQLLAFSLEFKGQKMKKNCLKNPLTELLLANKHP